MSHEDSGCKPLPAYAARGSYFHGLVLDHIDESNRSTIVHKGVGPRGVPILFRADGIVIFEFDKCPAYSGGAIDPHTIGDGGHSPPEALVQHESRELIKAKRFKYMNALLTCFHVALNRGNKLCPPLSSEHYIWAREEAHLWHLRDNGGALVKPLPFPGCTISLESLDSCLQDFRAAEAVDFDLALETLGMFYRAAFNMAHHEYHTVLVLGWTIIESCQDLIWGKFINVGYKRINPRSQIVGKRKALLLTDRNFTASIKSQILCLSGEYTDEELERIDAVRRRRNSFMHSMKPVTMSDAFNAMWGCGMVAEKALNLKLQPFGSPGGWDYKG